MAENSPLCMSCGVTNVFNAYFEKFAQQAFEIIGNGVVVLAFGFALGLAILWYAASKARPYGNKPLFEIEPILWLLGTAGALKAAAPLSWRLYEAMSGWSVNVALDLIAIGSGGSLTHPTAAVSPLAKVVGAAENVLWDFISFSTSAIVAPDLWEGLWDGLAHVVGSMIFSVGVLLTYGGLLLYFTFIVLRSQLYMILSVAFAPLIIGAAAFKPTRQVTWAGLRMLINGALTVIGAGVAMGFTAVVLRLSRDMVACYHTTRSADSCTAQIGELARAMGVSSATLAESFSRAEIFILLIFLGACCWLVHFVVTSFVAQLTNSANDAGPLAGFGLATAGIIAAGLRGGLMRRDPGGQPRQRRSLIKSENETL